LGNRTLLPGLTVARINPAVISEFQLPFSAQGLVITDLGEFGARVGIRTGDILLGINGAPVETARDVERALINPGRRVQMDVLRRGQRVALRFRT